MEMHARSCWIPISVPNGKVRLYGSSKFKFAQAAGIAAEGETLVTTAPTKASQEGRPWSFPASTSRESTRSCRSQSGQTGRSEVSYPGCTGGGNHPQSNAEVRA